MNVRWKKNEMVKWKEKKECGYCQFVIEKKKMRVYYGCMRKKVEKVVLCMDEYGSELRG